MPNPIITGVIVGIIAAAVLITLKVYKSNNPKAYTDEMNGPEAPPQKTQAEDDDFNYQSPSITYDDTSTGSEDEVCSHHSTYYDPRNGIYVCNDCGEIWSDQC
ncbi:MAG: hypothetical protein H6667_23760 [Ardenticatenaceae bacterium]|nr:hypothetical protein [Ardenticatenaceae bacterium]